jgi:hypothetical protein
MLSYSAWGNSPNALLESGNGKPSKPAESCEEGVPGLLGTHEHLLLMRAIVIDSQLFDALVPSFGWELVNPTEITLGCFRNHHLEPETQNSLIFVTFIRIYLGI